MSSDSPFDEARKRRLRAALAALVTLSSGGAVALGAVGVPFLSWLVPVPWQSTLFTVLILAVIAPGTLLAATSALLFGITVGWPRHRLVSQAVMLGVGLVFTSLWFVPMFGLSEQADAIVVIAGVLIMTFLIAPTVFGMMVRGVIDKDGEGEGEPA